MDSRKVAKKFLKKIEKVEETKEQKDEIDDWKSLSEGLVLETKQKIIEYNQKFVKKEKGIRFNSQNVLVLISSVPYHHPYLIDRLNYIQLRHGFYSLHMVRRRQNHIKLGKPRIISKFLKVLANLDFQILLYNNYIADQRRRSDHSHRPCQEWDSGPRCQDWQEGRVPTGGIPVEQSHDFVQQKPIPADDK